MQLKKMTQRKLHATIAKTKTYQTKLSIPQKFARLIQKKEEESPNKKLKRSL